VDWLDDFADSDFLGQTIVGHLVQDAATAKNYLVFWTPLKSDPERADASAGAISLSQDDREEEKEEEAVSPFRRARRSPRRILQA